MFWWSCPCLLVKRQCCTRCVHKLFCYVLLAEFFWLQCLLLLNALCNNCCLVLIIAFVIVTNGFVHTSYSIKCLATTYITSGYDIPLCLAAAGAMKMNVSVVRPDYKYRYGPCHAFAREMIDLTSALHSQYKLTMHTC